MRDSKKLEKSRGIVAFAYNTKTTDYISIAEKTLKLAEATLGLPSTLITNNTTEYPNTRYDIDLKNFVEWKNFDRYLAYELSPYDETIVIDADYLLLEDSILKCFELEWDYLLQRSCRALTEEWPKTMGPNSLPFVWATIFAFRKTERAKQFFDLVARIQKNYHYYRLLFNIQERNYRNDYAFAIADIILNGYSVGNYTLFESMLTINQSINSLAVRDNKLVVRDSDQAYILPITNLHIMSKAYLQSDNFAQFINDRT